MSNTTENSINKEYKINDELNTRIVRVARRDIFTKMIKGTSLMLGDYDDDHITQVLEQQGILVSFDKKTSAIKIVHPF